MHILRITASMEFWAHSARQLFFNRKPLVTSRLFLNYLCGPLSFHLIFSSFPMPVSILDPHPKTIRAL
jgi:hypothetical protein